MLKTKDKLLSDILKLSSIDKAELIEDILSSFEFQDRSQIDELWSNEVENRIDAYENGDLKSIPIEDVFNKIK